MFNELINSLNLASSGKLEIKEELLKSIVIVKKNGEKVDVDTYLKTLLIETLEEIVGGDKDERNS